VPPKGFGGDYRLADEAALQTEVVGRKHPRVCTRYRFDPQQVNACARPLGPLRSTRSNRTCLRLFLLSNRMRLIDVSSVKPTSCGRSAGQRSQYGATIRPVVSAGRTPVWKHLVGGFL